MDKIETKWWICNCLHGHQNCNCDGKTGAKKLKCVGCNETVYSKSFEEYRCEECYIKEMERKKNESATNRGM